MIEPGEEPTADAEPGIDPGHQGAGEPGNKAVKGQEERKADPGHQGAGEPGNKAVKGQEERKAEQSSDSSGGEAHGGIGAGQSGPSGDAQAGTGEPPGIGGYAGRDPATDMPRVPTVPETQDEDDPKGSRPE